MNAMTNTRYERRGRVLPAGWNRLRILAVDDHPELGRLLERLLAPHEVTVADSAAAAMMALATAPFDVVVSDQDMPGTDGVSLLTMIAAVYPRVHRILFSARVPRGLGTLHRDGTIHEFIEKPGFAEVVRVCDHVATGQRGPR